VFHAAWEDCVVVMSCCFVQCVVVWCSMLRCVASPFGGSAATHFNRRERVKTCCNVLHCVAVCVVVRYNALQHGAVCSSTMQSVASPFRAGATTRRNVLHGIAVFSSVVLCIAVCCIANRL